MSSALLLLSGFSSCKQEPSDDPAGAAAPDLLSCSPENGAQDLKGESLQIVLTFDQNVKCPSSKHSLVSIDNDAVVTKVLAYNTDVTITVSSLQEGFTYTLTIAEGAISGYKDNPAGPISYEFSMNAAEKDYERDPFSSLTNPNATRQAQELYALLLENYGKKTLSGAMGGTAWETSYTDHIAEQSGIYPAIVGFDYIFLNWPAKKWDGCPDYADITPVKTAWEAGNIIQIGWHWTVPSVEGESDLDNYSYNTRKFGVENALTEGTWQNELIDSQIAKLAGYMSLLQDAGIPVLFRPLHEAAGDYTWGAWFWWGFEGAGPCVRLWKYLRDALQNTYHLNNLIWVWTVQTRDGGKVCEDLDKAREWYPGDDYVDIVGADLYESKWTSQSSSFRYVNNSVMGRKMVALSEFGNLLDFPLAHDENAPWLYMMNWCNFIDGSPVLYALNEDGSYLWNNTAADWKKVLSDDCMLNRSDL